MRAPAAVTVKLGPRCLKVHPARREPTRTRTPWMNAVAMFLSQLCATKRMEPSAKWSAALCMKKGRPGVVRPSSRGTDELQ